jgi:uncharacterized protein YukE
MTNSRLLLQGLKEYHSSLKMHKENTQKKFQYLQNRWHILMQVYQGEGADQLQSHWKKTVENFNEYLNSTIRIFDFLDERIKALVFYERSETILGMSSTGSRSSTDTKSSSNSEETYLHKTWHKGRSSYINQSIQYHVAKHGKGKTAVEYTRAAMDFFEKHKHLGEEVVLNDGTPGIKIRTKFKVQNKKTKSIGGYWTKDGKLVTFWDDRC